MSPDEIITAPVVEGTGSEPPALETPQPAQAAPEPQPATASEVEAGSKVPQVPEPTRRRPASDYYRERQAVRELKEEVAALRKWREEQASLNQKPPVAPDVPDFDPAHFSPEHKRILAAREKALRDHYDAQIAALKQDFTGWRESAAVAEQERKQQEALEKLFPKTSPDSKETLQERIAKDPERAHRIKEFLIESGLNELSKTNPDLAVKYALMELGEAQKPTNPTVLKKTLMGGTGTGNPGMGDKRSVSEQDLLAEKKKLNDQLDANPSLRQDEKFMERRRQVLGEIERLVTKK